MSDISEYISVFKTTLTRSDVKFEQTKEGDEYVFDIPFEVEGDALSVICRLATGQPAKLSVANIAEAVDDKRMFVLEALNSANRDSGLCHFVIADHGEIQVCATTVYKAVAGRDYKKELAIEAFRAYQSCKKVIEANYKTIKAVAMS